jgi:phage-related protein
MMMPLGLSNSSGLDSLNTWARNVAISLGGANNMIQADLADDGRVQQQTLQQASQLSGAPIAAVMPNATNATNTAASTVATAPATTPQQTMVANPNQLSDSGLLARLNALTQEVIALKEELISRNSADSSDDVEETDETEETEDNEASEADEVESTDTNTDTNKGLKKLAKGTEDSEVKADVESFVTEQGLSLENGCGAGVTKQLEASELKVSNGENTENALELLRAEAAKGKFDEATGETASMATGAGMTAALNQLSEQGYFTAQKFDSREAMLEALGSLPDGAIIGYTTQSGHAGHISVKNGEMEFSSKERDLSNMVANYRPGDIKSFHVFTPNMA